MAKLDCFKHLGRIKPMSLSSHLESQIHLFERSKSQYARTRLQRWYFNEPLYLGSQTLLDRHIDYRILSLAQRLGMDPTRTIALATYNSSKLKSNARISLHRDANFCEAKAILVNDGAEATFFLKGEPGLSERTIHLRPGDVICFNAKQAHQVLDAQDRRFSLVLWHTKAACTYQGKSLSQRLADDSLLPF